MVLICDGRASLPAFLLAPAGPREATGKSQPTDTPDPDRHQRTLGSSSWGAEVVWKMGVGPGMRIYRGFDRPGACHPGLRAGDHARNPRPVYGCPFAAASICVTATGVFSRASRPPEPLVRRTLSPRVAGGARPQPRAGLREPLRRSEPLRDRDRGLWPRVTASRSTDQEGFVTLSCRSGSTPAAQSRLGAAASLCRPRPRPLVVAGPPRRGQARRTSLPNHPVIPNVGYQRVVGVCRGPGCLLAETFRRLLLAP